MSRSFVAVKVVHYYIVYHVPARRFFPSRSNASLLLLLYALLAALLLPAVCIAGLAAPKLSERKVKVQAFRGVRYR